jgi:hypothetical protein
MFHPRAFRVTLPCDVTPPEFLIDWSTNVAGVTP